MYDLLRAVQNQKKNLVAASILAADAGTLRSQAIALENAGADWIHLDVMDGHFVPPITFGMPTISALRPHLKKPFDVHLMIENPDQHLQGFAEAGADMITVHAEACPHLYRVLQAIRTLGKKSGVALNPGTSIEQIKPVLPLVDIVLVMTVNPGWGGQAFLYDMLEKIRLLQEWQKQESYSFVISVDGGINDKTAALAVQAGAHVVAAGSHCFKGETESAYQQNIESLRFDIPQ